ncbi:Bacteriophage phiKZ, Orf197 [uncultured Caudovirales phage]|uniref:Bacteriophage phiKZ, Orf197 n=1 Tax=uncultured Caudovirales phage TaxID=2100421 RepID=A0A6J5LGE0_9CAUD|nr:Bacteriophage phiKZ, Orf197 [uncultured Caudovirales phage]
MTTWLILILLFIKHFLADFCWQSNRMLKDKGHFGRLGGFQHAGLHGALTYVILMHFLGIQACVMLAVFDAAIHYVVDWVNRRVTVRLTTNDNSYWIWFGIDQLLHHITYLFIAFTTSILLTEYI